MRPVDQSRNGRIVLWDVATGNKIRQLDGHTGMVSGIAVSPDGRAAVSTAWDSTVIQWDVTTGKILHRFTDHSAAAYAPAISPDGRLGFAGSLMT